MENEIKLSGLQTGSIFLVCAAAIKVALEGADTESTDIAMELAEIVYDIVENYPKFVAEYERVSEVRA